MTPGERRSFLLAAVLLLAASLARYGWEARRAAPPLPPDSAGIRDQLLAESRRAREEAERRRRPLEEGERIDPNRAPAVELDRLPGVGPAVAEAIVRERETGGWFADAADLERVRGIGPVTAERIAPLLDLSRPPPLVGAGRAGRRGGTGAGGASGAGAGGFRPLTAPPAGAAGGDRARVDLNRATAAELEELRGIGPALSARILELRERKGGFRSVDELLEVRGIGPATLEELRPRVGIPP